MAQKIPLIFTVSISTPENQLKKTPNGTSQFLGLRNIFFKEAINSVATVKCNSHKGNKTG